MHVDISNVLYFKHCQLLLRCFFAYDDSNNCKVNKDCQSANCKVKKDCQSANCKVNGDCQSSNCQVSNDCDIGYKERLKSPFKRH